MTANPPRYNSAARYADGDKVSWHDGIYVAVEDIHATFWPPSKLNPSWRLIEEIDDADRSVDTA